MYKLLPGLNFQAFIFFSTGGNDNLSDYVVLDLGLNGEVQEIFDSGENLLCNFLNIVKIKEIESAVIKDVSEPWLDICGFDYNTPKIDEFFVYDKAKKKNVPGNDVCFESLEKPNRDVYPIDCDNSREELPVPLTSASYSWFAGRRKEGWDYFNKIYICGDKAELTANIKKVLNENAYIQAQKKY